MPKVVLLSRVTFGLHRGSYGSPVNTARFRWQQGNVYCSYAVTNIILRQMVEYDIVYTTNTQSSENVLSRGSVHEKAQSCGV